MNAMNQFDEKVISCIFFNYFENNFIGNISKKTEMSSFFYHEIFKFYVLLALFTKGFKIARFLN